MRLNTFSAPVVGDESFCNSFSLTLLSRRIWLDGDPITGGITPNLAGTPYRIPKGNQAVLVSPESHEPLWVRRYLIQDLNSQGFLVNNVPANTGKEELNEPWKLFKTCREMLDHLKSVRPTISLSDYLPDFNKNLVVYLQILSEVEPLRDKKSQLNDIVAAIKNLNPNPQTSRANINALAPNVKLLKEAWEKADLLKKTDFRLYKFLGLSLFLCTLSVDRWVFEEINAILLKDFKPILESKF